MKNQQIKSHSCSHSKLTESLPSSRVVNCPDCNALFLITRSSRSGYFRFVEPLENNEDDVALFKAIMDSERASGEETDEIMSDIFPEDPSVIRKLKNKRSKAGEPEIIKARFKKCSTQEIEASRFSAESLESFESSE